jgi:outer membrane immunogenic protein
MDPAYNWSGWYAGVNVGGSWGQSDVSSLIVSPGGVNITANQALISATNSPRLKPDGFTGGGQFGYNYQAGAWVLGVEADFDYLGLRSSRTNTVPFPNGGTFTTFNSVKTDWLFTLRPRAGYAFDRTLLYVTGGLAVTEIKYVGTYADFINETSASTFSKTKAGWTVGAGVEHAFTNAWSAKVEYLYTDFGTTSVADPSFNNAGGQTPRTFTHDVHLKTNTVRAGLNYHFGGPVVAKY